MPSKGAEMVSALDQIRVIELARVTPAELPGMMLADMGADVLKVETPPAHPLTDEQARGAVFSPVNRNKRSIALNLKLPEGQHILQQLAAEADVMIEGFRPGVTERLACDYETIRRINPRIVYCSMSGFGQTGPYRDRPAHDVNYLALAGILGLIGEAGRAPQIPLNLVADYGGAGLHAAFGIVTALLARERTGQGQHVDVSYFDTSLALLGATPSMRSYWAGGAVPQRGAGVLGGGYAYYSVYETRDGKYVTLGCIEPVFWETFCSVVERPDLTRFRHHPEHWNRAPTSEESRAREQVQDLMRSRTRDEWQQLLADREVCVGKVQDVDEVVADPHVRARDLIARPVHPTYGPIAQFGVPLKFSVTPGVVRTAAPVPGEHTKQVLASLGMTADDIDRLLTRGVVMSSE